MVQIRVFNEKTVGDAFKGVPSDSSIIYAGKADDIKEHHLQQAGLEPQYFKEKMAEKREFGDMVLIFNDDAVSDKIINIQELISAPEVRESIQKLIEEKTGLKYPESMHLQKDIEHIIRGELGLVPKGSTRYYPDGE